MTDNEQELEKVIDRIRKIRIQKGVSQFELSVRANFSQSFLANIESGKKKPSVMTIIRIANALQISPREFFPESEEKTRDELKAQIIELIQKL